MSSEKKSIDVIAVGHALVDIRIQVREFPAPDQESPILRTKWGAGGSAVNVSIAVKRLDMKSGIIAKIGFDSFGRIIVDELLKEGVDIRGLRVSWQDTGFTIVAIDPSGDITMYGYKGSAEDLSPMEIDEDLIRESKHLHVASLRIDTSLRALEIAKSYGLATSWDPGRVLSRKGLTELRKILGLTDIVLLNRQEAHYMTNEEDYKKAAEIIREAGPNIVVVKLGKDGSYILSKESAEYIPAFQVKNPVDTTGAGDAYAAGFITSLLRGYNLRKAALYASAVAALKIMRLGSHEVPSHEEVINFIWDTIPTF
ncbi:MAG: carbohydrate kinase family protein [Sulfolobales archaeon]